MRIGTTPNEQKPQTVDGQRLEQLSTRACQLLLGRDAQLTLFDRPRPAFWRNWAAELVKIAREIELIFGAVSDGSDTA